jgi:hypothetical protein
VRKYKVEPIIIVGVASGLLSISPTLVITKKAPKRFLCYPAASVEALTLKAATRPVCLALKLERVGHRRLQNDRIYATK